MASREARIILYGHFGSGNIGNDSSLEAMFHAIKKYRPTAEVIRICNGPQVVRDRFGIETMQISSADTEEQTANRLQKLWRRLSREFEFWRTRPQLFQPGDQFIIVGTGAVDDMAVKRPWNAPYDLYKWCKVAKRGGARVIFLSVGVGPILNRVSKILMLRALKAADYRSYRETAAFDYLKSVGYDTSGDLLYPDLVFSLPEESLPIPKKRSSPMVVGLGLINYHGWRHDLTNGEAIYQGYISKIKCFTSWLLARGYTIRIISGDDVDLRPVQEILDFVAPENADWQERLIVESITSVAELFTQIARTDIVVASRFHNVLCALMLERPVISIGYHEKNTNLMSGMGLESFCQHIETFTYEKVVEQFESYLSDMDQFTQHIQQRQIEYRRLLDEQYQNILLYRTTKN